jgi:hypothetical protein
MQEVFGIRERKNTVEEAEKEHFFPSISEVGLEFSFICKASCHKKNGGLQ